MNVFKDILKQMGERVRLSEDERVRMHHNIREYVAHTPLRAHQQVPQKQTILTVLQYRFTAVFVIAAVLLTSGVGVTFASTDALPGDVLYPVKEVAEELQQQLIFDETKKTEFAIDRAHRRLQEIEQLAARGELNEEREALATEKFEVLTQRAEERIAHIEKEQPQEAEALRLALTVGIEARVATLALRSNNTDDSINDARARIAQGIQEKNESTEREEETTLRIAAAPRTVAVSADTQSDSAALVRTKEQSGSAETEMGVQATTLPTQAELPTPPIALATLMRNITKQRKALEEIAFEKKNEQVQKDITEVLTRAREAQNEITRSIQLRDYATAQTIGRETLAMLYKTIAAVDARLDIKTTVEIFEPDLEVNEPQEEEEASVSPEVAPLPLPNTENIRIR
jgi:hypothetical protein